MRRSVRWSWCRSHAWRRRLYTATNGTDITLFKRFINTAARLVPLIVVKVKQAASVHFHPRDVVVWIAKVDFHCIGLGYCALIPCSQISKLLAMIFMESELLTKAGVAFKRCKWMWVPGAIEIVRGIHQALVFIVDDLKGPSKGDGDVCEKYQESIHLHADLKDGPSSLERSVPL